MRKISAVLVVVLSASFIMGCSKQSGLEIEVPAYQTIEDYMEWGEKNDVKIQLVNPTLESIEIPQAERMIEVSAQRLLKGGTLDIVVCEKGMTCTLISEGGLLNALNRK